MIFSQDHRQKKRVLVFLLVILLAGSLARLHGLNKQSLWYDELLNYYRSAHSELSLVLQKVSDNEPYPPAYYFFLHFIIKYFGDSETILRLPSALFGIFSIFLVFLIGRRLYSCVEGLIAAALTVFSYQLVYYSQEARPYAMLLLFTLLSLYFWLDIWQKLKNKEKLPLFSVAGYIISAVISCYTHYFGLYFIGLQALSLFLFTIFKFRGFFPTLFIYAIVSITYLPWLSSFKNQLASQSLALNNWIKKPVGIHPSLNEFFAFLFNDSLALGALFTILVFILIGVNIGRYLKQKKPKIGIKNFNFPTLILSLWIILPFFGAYLLSFFWKPILSNRNLIISLPAVYLLFSHLISRLPLQIKYKIGIFAVTIYFLAYNLIVTHNYYSSFHKERFREVANYLADNSFYCKDYPFIVWGAPRSCFSYYFRRQGLEKRNIFEGPWRPTINPYSFIQLVAADPEYLWYLRVHIDDPTHDLRFITFLKRNFDLVKRKAFSDKEEAWLFKRRENKTEKEAILIDYIIRYFNKEQYNKGYISSKDVVRAKSFIAELFGPPISYKEIENIKKKYLSDSQREDILKAEDIFKIEQEDIVILVLFFPAQDNYRIPVGIIKFKKANFD